MTTTRVVLFAAAALASGSSLAQTAQTAQPVPRTSAVVNKCTTANGSVVFSDKPCANNEKAQKVDTSAALRTGSGGNNGEIAAKVADSDCRSRAQQTTTGADTAKIDESNRHIADYQQRQRELASRKAYAADGSGTLIDDPNAQQEISKLDDAIRKEHEYQQGLQKSSGAAYDTALKACEAQAAKNAKAASDAKVK